MDHDLIEKLADVEHQRWADWQRYLHSLCTPLLTNTGEDSGDRIIPARFVAHWERQIATPYADLSEIEKESDREQVRRYLHIVQGR